MEKIGCKKFGGAIETLEAVKYFEEDTVCRSCPHYDLCREEREEQDAEN